MVEKMTMTKKKSQRQLLVNGEDSDCDNGNLSDDGTLTIIPSNLQLRMIEHIVAYCEPTDQAELNWNKVMDAWFS